MGTAPLASTGHDRPMPDLHPNVARVSAAARQAGLDIAVAEYPEGTRTAQDAAAAIGCEVARIVKSLAFGVDGEVVLDLVAGDDRLDEARLAAAAGGSTVARADADAVRAATGFPIGGVPPLGHDVALRTFLDEALLAHPTVWAAAGTPRHVFEVDPGALARAIGASIAALSVR